MEKQVYKPKLRFTEFKGEWEKKKLGDVCDIIGGGTPETNKAEYWNGEINWFTPTEIKSNFVSKSLRTISKLGLQKSSAKILPVGTILLTTRATIGEVSIALEECTTNQGFQSLITKNDYNNVFIFNWIKENKHELISRANGSTFPEISKTEIEKIQIQIPSLSEQTKIASFLTTVDDKLQALKKKKTLLEQYKKGVMQKIFSQELRFKDDNGNDYPDWEERKLGEIAISHYQGINTASEKTNYYSNGYPILQAKHITSETITYYDAKYVSVEDFEKHKEKYNPKINEILISNIGTLGKIVLIEQDVKFLIAWNIFKVKLKENLSNPKYITYVLKNVASKGYFEEVQSGNATKFVNKTEMLGIPIFLPTIPEQTKIANFLSAIDDKTQAVEVQIEKMEVWKKGLLQQMFC